MVKVKKELVENLEATIQILIDKNKMLEETILLMHKSNEDLKINLEAHKLLVNQIQ